MNRRTLYMHVMCFMCMDKVLLSRCWKNFNWRKVSSWSLSDSWACCPKYSEYGRFDTPLGVCKLKSSQLQGSLSPPRALPLDSAGGFSPHNSVIGSHYALAMSSAVPFFISFWCLCFALLLSAISALAMLLSAVGHFSQKQIFGVCEAVIYRPDVQPFWCLINSIKALKASANSATFLKPFCLLI